MNLNDRFSEWLNILAYESDSVKPVHFMLLFLRMFPFSCRYTRRPNSKWRIHQNSVATSCLFPSSITLSSLSSSFYSNNIKHHTILKNWMQVKMARSRVKGHNGNVTASSKCVCPQKTRFGWWQYRETINSEDFRESFYEHYEVSDPPPPLCFLIPELP